VSIQQLQARLLKLNAKLEACEAQLKDLKAQRKELRKQLMAAKKAAKEGQLIDGDGATEGLIETVATAVGDAIVSPLAKLVGADPPQRTLTKSRKKRAGLSA
jgi:chaperonin cofactor prefoldin